MLWVNWLRCRYPELVKALNDENSSVRRVRLMLWVKLAQMPLSELVKALNHENSMFVWSAAEALGKIGSDAAIEELVKALNDEDSIVRRVRLMLWVKLAQMPLSKS
jgi:HEAT repeat protein